MSVLFLLLPPPLHYLDTCACIIYFLKIHKEILLWNRVLTCKLILAVFVSFLSISSMFLFLWPQPTLDITIIPFLRIRIWCYVTQAVKQSLSQSLCGVPKALKCFSNLMILNFSLTNTSASSKPYYSILNWLVTFISPKAKHSNQWLATSDMCLH